MEVLGWKLCYGTYTQTVHAGITDVRIAKMVKNLYQKKVSIHWHVTNSGNTLNHPVTRKTKIMIPTKKIAIVMTEVRVWEVLGKFQELFTKVKEHQGVKRIQATESQNYLKDESWISLSVANWLCHSISVWITKGNNGYSVGKRKCQFVYLCKSITKTMLFCTNYKKLANELSQSTTIIHVSPKEVNAYRESNPFSKSVPVHDIFKLHAMMADDENSYLWSNFLYHKLGSKPNIQSSIQNGDIRIFLHPGLCIKTVFNPGVFWPWGYYHILPAGVFWTWRY